MQSWFIIQTFYHGLRSSAREYLDAAAGGSFFSLEGRCAKALIEKMVENQGWSDDRTQPKTRGVHQVEALDMLAAKMDLLMKKLEATAQETVQAMDARMTCEVCGTLATRGMTVPKRENMPTTSTTPTTTGTDRTTTAIKAGIRAQTSHLRGHNKVTHTIPVLSIISRLLEILCLAR